MRIASSACLCLVLWPALAVAQNVDLCDAIVDQAFGLLGLKGEEWADSSLSVEDKLYAITEMESVFQLSRDKRRDFFLDYADDDVSLGLDYSRSESMAQSARDYYFSLTDSRTRREFSSEYFRTLFYPWAPEMMQVINNCISLGQSRRGLILDANRAVDDQERMFVISLSSHADRGHDYTLSGSIEVIGAECVSNGGVTDFVEGLVIHGGEEKREIWRLNQGCGAAYIGVGTQEGGPVYASFVGELELDMVGGRLGDLLDDYVLRLEEARKNYYDLSWPFWSVIMRASWETTYERQAQSLHREIEQMAGSVRVYIDAIEDLLVLLRVADVQGVAVDNLVSTRDWLLRLSRMITHCQNWILLDAEPGDNNARQIPIVFIRRIHAPYGSYGEIVFSKSGPNDVYAIALNRNLARLPLPESRRIIPYDEKVRVAIKILEGRLGKRLR